MTFDTAFERSHAPNTMNAEKDKAPERVWLDLKDGSWFSRAVEDDEGAIADPDEVLYVRADLLATARKEAFKEAAEKVHTISRIDAKDKSRDFLSGAAWLQNKAALMLATLSVEAATSEQGERSND